MNDHVRTRRPLGPPMTSQVQRNIASACLSARYSEIARRVSREESQQRAKSTSLARRGSPASRPKRDGSPLQTPTKTPSAASVVSHRSDSIRSPSPRSKVTGNTTPRTLPRTTQPRNLGPATDTSHSPSPRGAHTESPTLQYLRGYSTQLKSTYGEPGYAQPVGAQGGHAGRLSPEAAASPVGVVPPSSLDYLQRVSGGVQSPYNAGIMMPPGATSTMSPVLERLRAKGFGSPSDSLTSPLVRSLNQQIHQVENQISVSLVKNAVGVTNRNSVSLAARDTKLAKNPGVGIGLRRGSLGVSPQGRSHSLPASTRVESANQLPATSMKHVSPPRVVHAVPQNLQSPHKLAEDEAALHSLRRELGRVRMGLGASRCEATGDWVWNEDSPAFGVVHIFLEAHQRYSEEIAETYMELASIAKASCGVFRAQSLVRDLGLAASHARELETVTTAESTALAALEREHAKHHQHYLMHHSAIGVTMLTLHSDGTHSSDCGGNGTFTLSDLPILGRRVATLCLEFDEGEDIVLTSPDQGKTWEGLPNYDTVKLEVDSRMHQAAALVQPWLSGHVYSIENEEERRVNAEAVSREAKLKAQIDHLRGVVNKLSESHHVQVATKNKNTMTDAECPQTPGEESLETEEERGMAEILNKAEQLRREGETKFSLGFPSGLDTPSERELFPRKVPGLVLGEEESTTAAPSVQDYQQKDTSNVNTNDQDDLLARTAEKEQIEADLALERQLLAAEAAMHDTDTD